MKCEEFEKHIADYVSGEIDPSVKDRMEAHYFECDECFDAIELMEAAVGEIAESGVEKLMTMAEDARVIKVIISGVEHVVEWVGEEIVLPIKKAGKVIIESEGVSLFSRAFQIQDFRGATATASKYGDRDKKEKDRNVLFEKDGIRAELEKSPKEGKIIISPVKKD
jgi:hypothetical protein